jgi:tungstate transport system substrate-binding protein
LTRSGARIAIGAGALGLVVLGPTVTAAKASPGLPFKVTNVVVQGGTTPTDSGLLQNVIEPGFKAAYPQYNLEYVSVGTGQAITNAENGEADAVFTHSPTLEASFVAGGYSYEQGGRLVMSSDFITAGPTSDPAGLTTGPQSDIVAAFNEIATAGAAGQANFVSRGDDSGTNVKELSIWALVHTEFGLSLNTLGEPGPSGTTNIDSWYHTTGVGQGQNLEITDQCPFTGGGCYTLADRGTFNVLQSESDLPGMQIVSQGNSGASAQGGATLLANPYHAYAVNPGKEPTVHINLAGALAFLDYLTSPAAQAAIGAYPNTTNPAFTPDARPLVNVTQGVPSSAKAGVVITVTGTVVPAFNLDPALVGQPVIMERASDGLNVGTTLAGTGGAFTITFTPPSGGGYRLYFPQNLDGIVTGGFRQPTQTPAQSITVTTVVTASNAGTSGDTITVSGNLTLAPTTTSATVQIQGKIAGSSGAYQSIGSPVSLAAGQSSYSTVVTVPSSGKWVIRAKYNDPGFKSGLSATLHFTAP